MSEIHFLKVLDGGKCLFRARKLVPKHHPYIPRSQKYMELDRDDVVSTAELIRNNFPSFRLNSGYRVLSFYFEEESDLAAFLLLNNSEIY